MNTRVQVEHCVTEMTTGIDIVKTGIRVAAGEPLPFAQEDVVLRGHAIECRINAEDAAQRFLPTPGQIATYREPAGPGVRVDSGVGPGSLISASYDPMVAKLIVWDADRDAATGRMLRALDEFEITGLTTLLPFHKRLLASKQWAAGQTCRDLIEDEAWLAQTPSEQTADAVERDEEVTLDYTVEVSGRRFEVRVSGARPPRRPSPRLRASAPRRAAAGRREQQLGGAAATSLRSPMQGTVLKIAVEKGAKVEQGALIAIIEAMKMENEVTAHKAGTISELPISVGASVASGDSLAVIESS